MLAVLFALAPRPGSAQEALPPVVEDGAGSERGAALRFDSAHRPEQAKRVEGQSGEVSAPEGDPPVAPTLEPLLVFGKGDGSAPRTPAGGEWDALYGVAFWTFLVLALLGLALYGLRRLSGGGRGLLGAETLQVIGRRGLSPRHTLFLVEAGGAIFLVGATRDRLAPLGEIRDPEAICALRARARPPADAAPGGGLFGRLLGGKLRDYEGPAHEAAREKDVDDILGEITDIRKTLAGWKPPPAGAGGGNA